MTIETAQAAASGSRSFRRQVVTREVRHDLFEEQDCQERVEQRMHE
jgi:hypothetical protein